VGVYNQKAEGGYRKRSKGGKLTIAAAENSLSAGTGKFSQ